MTYREAYEKAEWKLEKGEITIGEFDELTKSLDEEIRPHGEWSFDRRSGQYICSICEGEVGEPLYKWCPWCGADMRKKEGEANE